MNRKNSKAIAQGKIHGYLKKVTLLRGLSQDDLKKMASIAKVFEFDKGETIFRKSMWGDALYVVIKGRIKIFSASDMGKSKTFAFLDSGDFFGEMALLEREGRSAGAVAVTPSTLLTIHRRDFQAFLTKRPSLALALIKTLCKRLRNADKEIESLSFNSVLGRVAVILLDLAKRYGKKGPKGIRIDLELSHQELADMAGTAREMVTRIINRFSRTGCLEMDGKHLRLTDIPKLRSWIY